MTLRFTPARIAVSYIALGVLAIALLAVPLWYGFHANLGTFRAYVPGGEMQRLVDVFHRDGPQGLAAAVDTYAKGLPPGEIALFADAQKRRLAGNLPRWPAEVPDAPGTYGLAVDLGGDVSMRVVTSHVALPDGHLLLLGRESVRFDSLVALFWYGVAGAVAILLTLGLAFGVLLRRAHGQLGSLVEQRTAELRSSEERYERAMLAAEAGFWDWDVCADEFYISPKLMEMSHHAPGTKFAGRGDWVARTPIHPDDLAKWGRAVKELFASGNTRVAMEVRTVHGGETRWVFLSGLCVRDAGGKILRWTGSATDITERKRAEQALRLSEERYARAMEGSDAGHWDWNIVSDEMFVSARAREMLALPAGELPRLRAQIMALAPQHPDDLDAMAGKVSAGIRAGLHERDYRIIPRPGEVRWLRARGKVYKDERGAAVRMTGSLTDITERKLAADALRASEERFALAVAGSNDGLWDWNIVSNEMFLSERAQRIYGLEPGRTVRPRAEWRELVKIHPDDAAGQLRDVEDYLAGKSATYEGEWRVLHPDGRYRWVRIRGTCVRDAGGRPTRFAGSVSDIDVRRRAAEALQRSESYLTEALRLGRAGSFAYDARAHKNLHWSPMTYEIFDFDPAAGLPAPEEVYRRVHPEDAERVRVARGKAMSEKADYDTHYRIVRRDGTIRHLHATGHPTLDANGEVVELVGVVTDVTERKRAELELRDSEARFRALTELSSDAYWTQDENLRFTPTGVRYDLAGYRSDLHIGKTRSELSDATPLSSTWAEHETVLQARKPFRDFEYRRLGADGSVRYLSISGMPIFDEQGAFRGYQGIGREITDRKRGEQELRDSEARFRALTELSSDWYWRQDEELRFTYVSHQLATDRYPLEWVIGKTRWELLGITPLSSSWAEHQAVLAARQPFREFEYARIGQDGRPEYVSISGGPIFDEQGIFRGYQGVGRNISERKRAEEELTAMERKLRQSQRLEAMGTLAGGIAHDFNNILGAILGYGEMAMRDAAKGSRLRRDLDSIMAAGERGQALVDRVLAFSRSGVGERVPVHVEKVVREALDLVSARLPPNVTLHAKLHAGTAAMLGDATQVHQVLMNLATNAIQAMPAGGTLRVALNVARSRPARAPAIGTIPAGEHLVLAVADGGTGIAPEILDRIFDPFFTTKEVGTGTGLGLSLVHGIVTELGGAIDIATRVGEGSTFTVYLPRAGDAAEADSDEEPALPRGDGQRVLVVDDEEPLVRLATRTLEELGYAPVGFTSSSAALAAFRADPQRFDVVITDERMPGMSGSALIREVRGVRDRIPVVLMSGYVSGAIASRAREAGAEEVLKKPLSARDLAASLARVLHPH